MSWRAWLIGVLLAVLVAMLVVHAWFFETFTVPSRSMAPTYVQGERIIVDKRDHRLHRGDVIVFSGEGSLYPEAEESTPRRAADALAGWFGFRPGEQDYLKRVIGRPGDTVEVAHDGVLRVNGRPQPEPYLPQGVKASAQPFSVTVPSGKLFVMGDNRDASDDSRNHLGDPGGGFVPFDKVVGTVRWTYGSGS